MDHGSCSYLVTKACFHCRNLAGVGLVRHTGHTETQRFIHLQYIMLPDISTNNLLKCTSPAAVE